MSSAAVPRDPKTPFPRPGPRPVPDTPKSEDPHPAAAPAPPSRPRPVPGPPARKSSTATGIADDTPSVVRATSPRVPRAKAASTKERPKRAVSPGAQVDGSTPSRRRLTRVEETSAGGLVVDLGPEGPRAALIARHDRRGRLVWSLPKGHIEAGETAEQAAVREVREETGIEATVSAPLGVIDFWFVAENRRVHKTVHHFLLMAVGGELSDEDVEVSEVAWVPLDQVSGRLAHAAERKLLDAAVQLLDAAE